MNCSCGKPSHPNYGSKCEDCWANGYSVRHPIMFRKDARGRNSLQGAKRLIDRKFGDEYFPHGVESVTNGRDTF